MSYRGRIRNGVVILDPSAHLPEGSEVEVRPVGSNGDEESIAHSHDPARGTTLLDRYGDVVGIANGLPTDFAANHDHYIHGTPKRDE